MPGQGNANPASLFERHNVACIGGKYYDPSYGASYNSLQEIDDAMDGFYHHPKNSYLGTWPVDESDVNLDLNSDGDIQDFDVEASAILFKKNPDGLDLEEATLSYE